jgi:hypothetical protein
MQNRGVPGALRAALKVTVRVINEALGEPPFLVGDV